MLKTSEGLGKSLGSLHTTRRDHQALSHGQPVPRAVPALRCHRCPRRSRGVTLVASRPGLVAGGHCPPRRAAVPVPGAMTRGHGKHRAGGNWGRCGASREALRGRLPRAFPCPPQLCAACQSLMPRHRPSFCNVHYDKMRSAGKSPLLINMFPAYLEIFWSQRQFAFWETASLPGLSNNSSVKHLPVARVPFFSQRSSLIL